MSLTYQDILSLARPPREIGHIAKKPISTLKNAATRGANLITIAFIKTFPCS
jgi:hypothetical protein